MTEAPINPQELPEKPGWRARIKAWWNGTYNPGGMPAESDRAEEGAASNAPARAEPTVKSWSIERINAVQDIFGAGFHLPGGDEFNHRVYMPTSLDANKSAVELNAGLGSMTRSMAGRLNMWMTAYEPNALLVARANAIADGLDLEKRASLKCLSLDRLDLRERSLDAVVARESLYLLADKQSLYAKIRKALRPNGSFSFIDYFGSVEAGDRIMEGWAASEPSPPHLLTIDDARALMGRLGFEVRVTEDITQVYKSAVLRNFAAYAEQVKEHNVPIEDREWAINEGEHWAIRLAAMEVGRLKVFRVLACAPAEARR